MRNGKFNRGIKFIFCLPIVALIVAVLGYVVMFLWNSILPEVTNAGQLNFWQAVGLLVLCRILFGNFGKGGGNNRFREKAREMRSKWDGMDEDERAKFKEEYKKRCMGWRHRSKE